MQQSSAEAVVRRLSVRDFRNYRSLDVPFSPGLTVFTGLNGQGKTNLLEALYYLAFLRSFRTRQIAELIRWGSSQFSISGQLCGDHTMTVHYGLERELRQNDTALTKASEFINSFLCVPLLPDDIELAKGPASTRRRYLDMLIGQLDRAYLGSLHAFLQTLKMRNAVLRALPRYGKRGLDAFTAPLVQHGTQVILHRLQWAERLAPLVAELAQQFLPLRSLVRLDYRPGFPRDSALGRREFRDGSELAPAFQQLLLTSADRDVRDGVTLYGPQRDDLDITWGDHALATFGSEGQCRLVAILLRLASLALLRDTQGRTAPGPVLLVDDVFGELDVEKRQHFWEKTTGVSQIFLTCTELPIETRELAAVVYRVQDGTLLPLQKERS